MATRTEEKTKIQIEITPGEACDRLAILRVKFGNIKDPDRQVQIIKEAAALGDAIAEAGYHVFSNVALATALSALRWVHEELWAVENELRRSEAEGFFSASFIRAAREVYKLNDHRSAIKKEIDERFGYTPEVKEYTSYNGQGKMGPLGAKQTLRKGTNG